MPHYRKTIKSGNLIEVEYYFSQRTRNKASLGRSCRQSLTPEKQKKANRIRAEKETRRLIANNFTPGKDMYLTITSREDMSESEFGKAINNFLRRLKYYRQKHNLSALRYIGAMESGKKGTRWHFHVVVNEIEFKILEKLWTKGRIWAETLYMDGLFEDLAKYLRKDVTGKKRLKQSRNLIKPKERVTEIGKKKLREFECGVAPSAPEGFYMVDAQYSFNDYTGTSAVFVFLPLVPVDVGNIKK